MEDIANVPIRKRGRPAGKCRKPLNREQRKARNAQYERERRGEIAEATSQLMEAIGLDASSSVSVSNLLNIALDHIKNKLTPTQSIETLRKRNDDLCKEIQDLENLLSKQQKKQKKDSSSSKTNKRGIKRKAENEPPSNIIEEQDNKRFVEKSEYDFEMESDDLWSCLG
ncbi:PREDICTED: uncharacterized protein LOC106120374 [Papilio xuthus]|uniref:Uncharacterized protein LOC106120374 n=1 Tax=Papilio xuthus TaxID=66420 RepID=A0AAJ6ZEZ9_PAPXU|nr:PREDICTED: uncharacterized protein LOC106120374 [Papilio xuthus]